MEKINFNIFIEKCKNKNVSFLGSINKDIDFVKNVIDSQLDKIEINYNRCLHEYNNNKLTFSILNNDGSVSFSYLERKGQIFYYKECYIIVSDHFCIVYKISNLDFLNFAAKVEDQNIKKEKSILLKNKYSTTIKKFIKYKKEKEIENFFNHDFFDIEKINKLTNLQKNKLIHLLKKHDFIDYLKTRKIYKKEIANNLDKYNRRHFNRLDHTQQKKYLSNLENKKIYRIYFIRNGEEFQRDIQKSIYDILKVTNPDVTINAGATASPGAITNNIFLLEKVENSIVDPPTNFFKYFLVLLSKCSLQSSFIAANFLKG